MGAISSNEIEIMPQTILKFGLESTNEILLKKRCVKDN